MADGHGQRIRSVFLGDFRQIHQGFDHLLHLTLGGLAVADHGIFNLQGAVFGHRQVGVDTGDNRRAPRLAEL